MTVNNIPLILFFQRVLDPMIIMGCLYVLSFVLGVPFSGYSLVLMVLAFFISSSVYQYVDPYRSWRTGRRFAYVRDVVMGWVGTVLILLMLGSISGLTSYYNHTLVLAWFIVTPIALLLSHLTADTFGADPAKDGNVRSVLIVGANDVGIKFAQTIERNPLLYMSVNGFFDDRAEERRPENLRHPMLGKMGDIAAYVREHHIQMIFISQPISAQPRIRKLLDELQDTTASVYFLPDIYVFDLMQARFDNVGGMPVIAICESPFTGINSMVKRVSDIVLAVCIQLLLLPIMLVIALAVKDRKSVV